MANTRTNHRIVVREEVASSIANGIESLDSFALGGANIRLDKAFTLKRKELPECVK